MKRIWNLLISLDICLWLMAAVCLAMAAGSFVLSGEVAEAINAMPLFSWLIEASPAYSWWLWITLVLLMLLVINTICCGTDTFVYRWRLGKWLSLLGPQLVHAGFLLVVAAHLVSALGGGKQAIEVYEGVLARLPNGDTFGVARISATISPMGMPVGYSAELATNMTDLSHRKVISPNNPWFSGGYGVYIKQAEIYPYKRALLEIHREPGAALALSGALLFTLGNLFILWVRRN